MREQCQKPLPPTRWSLEDAVKVLHQNGLKLKLNTLSKLNGGIEFEVYSAPLSEDQAIVFKYPSERWVYNDNDWGIDRFQLLRQERDLLRFAREQSIPAPEVLAYFDPADGPEVLVLEEIKLDGTLPSDSEIGETVRRLHGLSPPALYTVAQGTQIPSSKVAELTVRRLNVVERFIGDLRWKPTVQELDRILAPIKMDARLLHMDLRPANYLCQRNRLIGLIDWSNALIAAPVLELARIAEYGGLSPAFATGYKLTSDMTAALDQEIGIACRLYTTVMLCVLFLAQLRLFDKAERQIRRLKELLGLLERERLLQRVPFCHSTATPSAVATPRAVASIGALMSNPTMFPRLPSLRAAIRATIPVPQATSSTRSPARNAAAPTKSSAQGAKIRGTR
jgi:hypothetical protein